MLFFIRYTLKMVGTSRDSRDMACLLGLRCPDFLKQIRDSRDKLSAPVHCRLVAERKTFAKLRALKNAARIGNPAAAAIAANCG